MYKLPFYKSNLLPAAPVSHCYDKVWIRDNWYCGICSDEPDRKRIWSGLIDILDRYEWKLKLHGKQEPKHWFEYMHIRYDQNGYEIPEGWRHKQWDAIGNWLEVSLDEERFDLSEALVDYLSCVKVYRNPAATAWEDEDIFDPYTLAAVIHPLQRAKPILKKQREKIEFMVRRSTSRLYTLLPFANVRRRVCLSQLGTIWPFDCAGPYKKEIIELVKSKLMRQPFGFARYEGDTYDGEFFTRGLGTELPWLLGDLYMAHIEPDNDIWMNRIEAAYKTFGCLPEAYFPETMKPNRNTPLIWAEAMYNDLKRSKK